MMNQTDLPLPLKAIIIVLFCAATLTAATIDNNYKSSIFISNGLKTPGNNEITLNHGKSFSVPESWGNLRHSYVHIRDDSDKSLTGSMANKYGTLKLAVNDAYVVVSASEGQVFRVGDSIPDENEGTTPDPPVSGNLIKNANFNEGMTYWQTSGNVQANSANDLILTPDSITTSKVTQQVSGLQTGKEYQLCANVKSTSVWAYAGVIGVGEKGRSTPGAISMKFIAPGNNVKVYLQTWKKQSGNVSISDVSLRG
ncbi:MAG: hypothetical protein GY750_08445 [Lentisphaerae bacterium]|nr:hypothetical protein [Lentisphaerota bacterium]MCP4101439.1 hypothetical protein [Lentisphaerota bacterium]